MRRIFAALFALCILGSSSHAISYRLLNEHFLDAGNLWNYRFHITKLDSIDTNIWENGTMQVGDDGTVDTLRTKLLQMDSDSLGHSLKYCVQDANFIYMYKEEFDYYSQTYTDGNPLELYPVSISSDDNDLNFGNGNFIYEDSQDPPWKNLVDSYITYLYQEPVKVAGGSFRCNVINLKTYSWGGYYGIILVRDETDWIDPQVGLIKASVRETVSYDDVSLLLNEYTYELISTNVEAGEYLVAPEPVLSLEGGIYIDPPQMRISCAADVNIFYTIDGTEPTANSILYDGNAVTINQSCTFKAKGVKNGYMDSNCVSATFAVSPPEHRQDRSNGIISIEAEKYAYRLLQGQKVWIAVSSPAGASGGYAMQALPETGAGYDYATYLNSSPRLDYAINFASAGTYYVWVRGYATSSHNDSVHIGLDNAPTSSCDKIAGFAYRGWSWSRKRVDGSQATIYLPSSGRHILNVWMREDGFRIDKIILTANPNYVPAGTGPGQTLYSQESSSGLVQMEAENYNFRVAPGGRDWKLTSSPAGASGGYSLQALPDIGAGFDYPNYLTSSPRLDFNINFVKTGTHYVWIRAYATSSANDFVHAGLDDATANSKSDKIGGFTYGKWSWSRKTLDGPAASINVKTTGIHTFSIWMREDGFRIDKILITTSSSYVPAP